jgi:hypothetical protein
MTVTSITKRISYNESTAQYDCTLLLDNAPLFIGTESTYSLAEQRCAREYTRLAEVSESDWPAIEGAIAMPIPRVRVQRFIGPPDVDGHIYITGTQFLSGADDAKVEVYFPDDPDGRYNVPEVYMLRHDGFPLTDFARVFPHIVAVMTDRRVRAAIQTGTPEVERTDIRVERRVCDDHQDPAHYGQELGTEYTYGDGEYPMSLSFSDTSPDTPMLCNLLVDNVDMEITLDEMEQRLLDALVLLRFARNHQEYSRGR